MRLIYILGLGALLLIGVVLTKTNQGSAMSFSAANAVAPLMASGQIETNKRVVRRLYEEIVAGGNLALIEEIIRSDAIDRTSSTPGREGFRKHIITFRKAYPDIKITVDDLVAEGDRVVAYWTFQGTHQGEFFGVPPNGHKVTGRVISILTFNQSQIVEYNARPDTFGILRQLGSLGRYAEEFSKASK